MVKAGTSCDPSSRMEVGTSCDPAPVQVTTYTVVNVRKHKAHCATSASRRSLCGWFTCGTFDEPASGATFGDVGTAEKCTICFRDGMRRR